jgi:hypothetical protein
LLLLLLQQLLLSPLLLLLMLFLGRCYGKTNKFLGHWLASIIACGHYRLSSDSRFPCVIQRVVAFHLIDQP